MEEKRAQDSGAFEEITLVNDAGASLVFHGRVQAENSFYDGDSGTLTVQRLYVTSDGHQAYSVVSGAGASKERRAYIIKREGQLCRINNGLFDVTINAADLLTAVKGLCGLQDDAGQAEFLGEALSKDIAANE